MIQWRTTATLSLIPAASSSTASIKLSPSNFPNFSGKIANQESFMTKAEAQIGQTSFKFLLTRDAVTQEERERVKELFNIFNNSFHSGKSYNVITQSLKDNAGNELALSGKRMWINF
eukprot:7400508-Ditylum_brightwellii.AAC.1